MEEEEAPRGWNENKPVSESAGGVNGSAGGVVGLAKGVVEVILLLLTIVVHKKRGTEAEEEAIGGSKAGVARGRVGRAEIAVDQVVCP